MENISDIFNKIIEIAIDLIKGYFFDKVEDAVLYAFTYIFIYLLIFVFTLKIIGKINTLLEIRLRIRNRIIRFIIRILNLIPILAIDIGYLISIHLLTLLVFDFVYKIFKMIPKIPIIPL